MQLLACGFCRSAAAAPIRAIGSMASAAVRLPRRITTSAEAALFDRAGVINGRDKEYPRHLEPCEEAPGGN